MNQLLIGIILVLSLGSYYLYQENQTLTSNNLFNGNDNINPDSGIGVIIFKIHHIINARFNPYLLPKIKNVSAKNITNIVVNILNKLLL